MDFLHRATVTFLFVFLGPSLLPNDAGAAPPGELTARMMGGKNRGAEYRARPSSCEAGYAPRGMALQWRPLSRPFCEELKKLLTGAASQALQGESLKASDKPQFGPPGVPSIWLTQDGRNWLVKPAQKTAAGRLARLVRTGAEAAFGALPGVVPETPVENALDGGTR